MTVNSGNCMTVILRATASCPAVTIHKWYVSLSMPLFCDSGVLHTLIRCQQPTS